MSRSNNAITRHLPELAEEAFCAWVGNATPGQSIAYYRGFIAIDIAAAAAANATHRANLVRVARRAMRLSQQGLIHLVQRREADRDFTYIAIARPRPLSNVGTLNVIMAAAFSDKETNADTHAPGRVRRAA